MGHYWCHCMGHCHSTFVRFSVWSFNEQEVHSTKSYLIQVGMITLRRGKAEVLFSGFKCTYRLPNNYLCAAKYASCICMRTQGHAEGSRTFFNGFIQGL